MKVPPHDLAAERAVIGCVLLNAECWDAAASIVRADDFYKDAHSVVWRALQSVKASGSELDTITLQGQLEAKGELHRVGGFEYVLGLTDTIPTVEYANHYATRVRDLAVVRSVMRRAYELIAKAYEGPEDIAEFLDEAETALGKECEQRTGRLKITMLSDAVRQSIENLVARAESGGGIKGHRSGFSGVDYMLSGFNAGDVIIVAGRPGMGKTSFAFDVTRGIVYNTQLPALVFSLEMPADQLSDRALASQAGFNLNHLRSAKVNREQWEALMLAAGLLSEQQIQLIDTPGITVLDIQRELRAFKRRFGACGVVCIDYLQLMSPAKHTKGENREQQISEMTRTIKKLARSEQVPIILLSQLNRGLESRSDKRPQLSDLRESGAIEQDADTILFIYRDEKYNDNSPDKGIAEIIIGKQRQGATGTVRLRFTGEYTRFDNLEEQREEYY